MKKLLTLVVLVGYTTAALAQKNCKNVDDKKDEFTGKISKHTSIDVGNMLTKWINELDQADGQTTMKWTVTALGELNAMFPESTIMMFKLEDGNVLKLSTAYQASAITQVTGGGVFTQYNLIFNLTKEELTSFAQSPIENMKIDVPGLNVIKPSLGAGRIKKIMDACACLLTTAS